MTALPADFWERHSKDMRSWKEGDRTFYELSGPAVHRWQPNQGVYEDSAGRIEGIVRQVAGDAPHRAAARLPHERHNVWGIIARNREQNFALNLLMDPEIDFVTMLGPAGTGKTLLALAAGLMQTLEANRFVEIIMTRVRFRSARTSASCPARKRKRWSPGWAR